MARNRSGQALLQAALLARVQVQLASADLRDCLALECSSRSKQAHQMPGQQKARGQQPSMQDE